MDSAVLVLQESALPANLRALNSRFTLHLLPSLVAFALADSKHIPTRGGVALLHNTFAAVSSDGLLLPLMVNFIAKTGWFI